MTVFQILSVTKLKL